MVKLLRALLFVGSLLATGGAYAQSQVPSGTVQSNCSAASGLMKGYLLTDCLDRVFGSTTDRVVYRGSGGWVATALSAYGRTLIDDADAATARATLGVVIGTNVQAWDADLDAFALKTAPTGAVVGTTDTQTLSGKTLTAPVINSPTGIAKGDVGLGNVDNTSDATKNSATATLTGKTIAGASNTLTVRLANDVTGTLPVANGGTGDTGTAWAAFSAGAACGTATFTVTATRFKTIGKTTFVQYDVTVAAMGTCTGSTISFATPNVAQSSGGMAGKEIGTAGVGVFCLIVPPSTATCAMVAGTLAVGSRFVASGVYEAQ